jgi:hypothetical protein
MKELINSLNQNISRQLKALKFGEEERSVLDLFYDERLKARRLKVPKFHFYARMCDGKKEDEWMQIMLNIDRALQELKELGYVSEAPLTFSGSLKASVGNSAESFALTADGLEILQEQHPVIVRKFKAWIAVLPPWVLLAGTIAGAIGAVWKAIELGMQLAQRII